MRKITLVTLLLLTFIININGQNTNTSMAPKPFIEITGMSETEITPDEIYITITLQERPENKEKLTIDKQEDNLKQSLKELGIDLINLTLNSAEADYRKIKTIKKDVIISKSYLLKVATADMLGKVYEKLDKINAYDAYVSRVSHSKIQQLAKDNRVKAIKAAKEKVDYLLAALGQQAGQPVQISEMENNVFQPFQAQVNYRLSNSFSMKQSGSDMLNENADSEIAFKKIKISASFLVKYEILNK
jgi:hypothetical protein